MLMDSPLGCVCPIVRICTANRDVNATCGGRGVLVTGEMLIMEAKKSGENSISR